MGVQTGNRVRSSGAGVRLAQRYSLDPDGGWVPLLCSFLSVFWRINATAGEIRADHFVERGFPLDGGADTQARGGPRHAPIAARVPELGRVISRALTGGDLSLRRKIWPGTGFA
jgi:hypothetical protein